jgi:hypothetical protein
MIRIPNLLAIAAIVSLPVLTIEGVQILRQPAKRPDKYKINFEPQPPQDYVPRFQNVALAPMCPRSAESPLPVSESTSEYDHCPKCQAGVFFQREDKLTCSYCEAEKQG